MVSEQITAPPPRGRLSRGSAAESRTWPRRTALLLIAGLAGLAYAWALNSDPLEPYYQAAVRSMSMSWHDFAYGAFDPAGTITLDKLPGAFWVQALAVRAFGYHTWAMVLPQVVEGVLTVLVAYRAVQRLAGPGAGLIAAAVLAVSPATVALNRGNISDSLMILLLVLAADAVSAAVVSGRLGWLILAGFWVGLAFQAKMIEAWLVLPAFGLVYLVSGPGPAWRRVRQLVAAGLVAGVVSLAWMTAVTLVPAAHRPYLDGSHNNSAYQQVFVYNGFGRFGDQTPLQLLAGQLSQVRTSLPEQPPGAARLLHGDLGRDTGWLLPAAVVIAGWGIICPAPPAPRRPAPGLLHPVGRLAAHPGRGVLADHDDQPVLHGGAHPSDSRHPRRRGLRPMVSGACGYGDGYRAAVAVVHGGPPGWPGGRAGRDRCVRRVASVHGRHGRARLAAPRRHRDRHRSRRRGARLAGPPGCRPGRNGSCGRPHRRPGWLPPSPPPTWWRGTKAPSTPRSSPPGSTRPSTPCSPPRLR